MNSTLSPLIIRIGAKGELTIPVKLRESFGWKAKTKLVLIPTQDGKTLIIEKLKEARFNRHVYKFE